MSLHKNADTNIIPANEIEPSLFYEGNFDEVLKDYLFVDSQSSQFNTDSNRLLQDSFANESFVVDESVEPGIDSFNQSLSNPWNGNGVQEDQTGQQVAQIVNINAAFLVSVQGQPDPLFTVAILPSVVASAEEVGISSSEKADEAPVKNPAAAVKTTRGKQINSKKPYERKKAEKKPKQHEIPNTPAAYQRERRERIEREQKEKDEKITHLTAENREMRELVESLQEEKLSRTETKMLFHQLKWFIPQCVRVVKLGDNLAEAECAALSDQEKSKLLNGLCPGGSCNVIIKRNTEFREIFICTEHAAHGRSKSSTSA